MLKFNGALSRTVAAALRRMRDGPLPEVSEVDWSEWEHSVAAWEDSLAKSRDGGAGAADGAAGPERGTGSGARSRAGTVPDGIESDWTTWEAAVKAVERARKRRSERE